MGGHFWAQVYGGPLGPQGSVTGGRGKTREAEHRGQKGVWRSGWAKMKRAHTLCTCCVPGPCVPAAPSDPARQAWVSVSRMRNCGVVGRATRPQGPGLHYLPAAHWARGWGRDCTEGLGPAGSGPQQEEKLLLTGHERGAAGTWHIKAPSVSLQFSQGASGPCCSTSPKPPWPRPDPLSSPLAASWWG